VLAALRAKVLGIIYVLPGVGPRTGPTPGFVTKTRFGVFRKALRAEEDCKNKVNCCANIA